MIALTVVAVVGLGVFSLAVAGLTTLSARRPERAAVVVVLVFALAAVVAIVLGLLVLGVTGMRGELAHGVAPRAAHVSIDPTRATLGLSTAGVLLGVAAP